ncbi:MAG TPA: glucose 1-dehydrogenase [Rhodobacteraceae bacterium]|nr:glucose 1-dehydrogenase [Paracoccaceae bacterium]
MHYKSANNRLAGKTALVTGAGSGFGAGIAQAFIAEGASVLLVDIDINAAGTVAQTLGDRARPCQADVSCDADIKAAVASAVSAFGHLDIIVNNAGITHDNSPMLDVSEAEFDRIFAVNVKSVYLTARHAVPAMRAHGGGVILNIASTAGVRPRPGLVWYNGSKGAMISLTKAMAIELAGEHIRVNAINPVAGETPLLAKFMGGDTPEKRELFRSSIPWGRLSRPSDIASAAVFLCSDESEMITGTALNVDGGRCI